MARRKPKVYELNWGSFDSKYTYAHKERNADLLASQDPLWLDIFESQPEEVRKKIAEGQVSLEELEAQRKAISDKGYKPNVVDTLVENPELSPEEAGIVAEAQPIDSRLEALGTHFTSSRGIASADADFEDLDSLRQYETPESRKQAKEKLEADLAKMPATRDMTGYRNKILVELERVAEAEKLFTTPGEFDRRLQEIGSKRILSGRDQGRVEQYYKDTGNVGTRTVGDVISQPESALPIIGGIAGGAVAGPVGASGGAIAGATPMAKRAYDAAYTEARLAGVDQETAKTFATAMMGSEFVLEAIGGRVAGGLSGVLKDQLKKYVPELAGKTATKMGVAGTLGAGVGYAEEAGTEVLQNAGALFGAELADNPEFKKFLTGQIPRAKDGSIDVGATLAAWNRSGLAGAGQGGPITAAGAGINNLVEQSRKEQQAVLANTVGNEAAKARYSALIDAATRKAEELGRVADGQLKLKKSTETSPLDVISSQYTEVGGGLTDGTTMPAITSVLTPEQRAGELKKKIEGMGTIPTAPKAPVKPSVRGSKPVTLSGKSKLPLQKKPAPTAKQEPSEAPTQAELLKKIEGLKSERAPDKLVTPGQKARNVIGYLSRRGTADSDDVLELVNKGKLGIVDKESDLPDGLEKGRDGWYDPVSKRVYLVAENLSKNTVRGTALHEINHFLNRNKKDAKTSTGITKLISGNLDTYNNRITNLAKSGNKIAQRALASAQEDGNVKEELTSYFATEALAVIQNRGILGTARQVYKDIKSAINTTARDKGIGELTDNDISYILRRQVEDAPSVDFTDGDTGLSEGRASIIGERSPDFQGTVQKYPERKYEGKLDNRSRIEISDRKATVNPITPVAKKYINEVGMAVKNVLNHDDLYKAYPDNMTTRTKVNTKQGDQMPYEFNFGPISNVKVKGDSKLNGGMAYDIQKDTIFVSDKALESPNFKGQLLHEMQHAIQARENFANGASVDAIYKKLRDKVEKETGELVGMGTSEDWEIRKQAWQEYDSTYGEAEARLSEGNFNLTDEELSDQLPEDRMTVRTLNDKNEMITSKARADSLRPGSRPLMRAEKKMPLDLPQGLASIKPSKGGEFDPFFVRGMFNDFVPARENADINIHAERMLKNYLSRWAGTEADPLKNVMMTDDRSWESMWDKALRPVTKERLLEVIAKQEDNEWLQEQYKDLKNPKIPMDTVVWGGQGAAWSMDAEEGAGSAAHSASTRIGEYLSHVGDYLLTVPSEDLGKYDLIRAVRETQAWDEAARKKAEKQKAISDSKLKTYIQFPDGYRWVRLDSPGQFAAESDMMGHSVRGYEPVAELHSPSRVGVPAPAHPDWIEGAEGGNSFYGYGGWEAIKKDHARIYSLRDPKGKSVVTVELGKEYDDRTGVPFKQFEVSQIKGRYNEAPDPSLRPKVYDLLLNLNEEELLDTEALIGDDHYLDLERDGNGTYAVPGKYMGAVEKVVEQEDATGQTNLPMPTLKDVSFWKEKPTTKRVQDGLASKSNLAKSDVGVWDDTGMSIVKLLFDPNKGIGKQGLETRDYWRLKSAGYRDLAEGVQVRLNHQIKKLGINYDEFVKAVRKAEKQKTPEERERALDGLVRSYGEAGVEYREGRMLIDNLSKQILKDWYNESQKTGRKANQEEINRYQTILDNLGEYSTRIYLSDIPHVGKDYAKGVLRQFDKGDESSPYYNIVKEAREFLLKHEVGIPAFDEMVRRKTETVRRTYQTWIGPGANLKKMDMIYALEAKRDEITPEELDKMVSKVIREMLGLDNTDEVSPVAKYYRAGALDEGILKSRQKVPKPLRRLLGEVTDPGQRILTTISAQADLLFKNRMLNDFYDNGEGKYWIKTGDRVKEGNEKFSEKLPNTGYGPLDGVYVTKPFAYAIKAQRTQITDLKQSLELAGVDPAAPLRWSGEAAVKLIGGLSMAQKMTKTALDQGAWALNAAGSPLALLKNGQVLGASRSSRQALVDALTLAVQAMGVEHKLNKETNARLATLLEHGIPDSVFTAELRDTEKEFYQKLLNDLNPLAVDDPREFINILKKSGRGGKRALRGIRDIYGLLDSWVKIADFYGQQEYFSEYHKANGDNLSQEEINRKAADQVKFRNITYSRSPLGVQVAEKAGVTVFATFASEVIRTMVTTPYTVKMNVDMARTAKTPEARNIALQEATKVGLGYLTALSIIPAFTHIAINSMWPEEDEEDRERFLKLWFPQDRDQSFVVAGKNEDGGVVMFNAARADPHGHVTDFIRQVAQGDSPEDFWNNTKALFTSPLGNGYMADLVNLAQGTGPKDSALADMAPGAQKELGDLFETLDGSRGDADRLTRVLDNFLPGAARVFDADKYKVTGDTEDAMVTNALAHAGMRMTVIDPKKIAGFEAMAYNNARADASMKWNELMHTDNLEKEDIVRAALSIYEKEQEAQRRLNEVYSGLGSDLAGVNPRKLLAELKVNPEDINDAALGRYRSVVLSGPRLREQENRQLGQAKTAEDKKKLRENYRLARETLRELQLLTR